MLDVDDYLNHWKLHYGNTKVPTDELTETLLQNAFGTVTKANQLLETFGEHRDITSGWRPVEVNQRVPGAALYSNHTRCMAVDLADPDGDLDEWCMENRPVLEEIGLWQEHPAATKGWCHVQTIPPKSGKRVFYP